MHAFARIFFVTTFAAACSSGNATDPGTAGATRPTEPVVAPHDPSEGGATVPPVAPNDAGSDSGPVDTVLLTLTIDGAPVTPSKVVLEKHKVFGMSGDGVVGEVEGRFDLPPGPADTSSAPYITLDVYTPLVGAVPYSPPGSTSQPRSAYLQYHYQRPGTSGFPKATGAGMNLVRDGRDGWFEASATGTFLIDGTPRPFTLHLRQPVDALP